MSQVTVPDARAFPGRATTAATSALRRVTGRRFLLPTLVVIAFVVRLAPVLRGGGLLFYGRYDDGVYYTAAEALTFGRVPYRDFVLLHPPALMLFLTPFVLLGRLTSDPVGLAAGRIVFMAIGATNAGLVFLLASRWGRSAGLVAGLLYACWFPAVYDEQSTLLEPLGGAAVLVALLLLATPDRLPGTRREVVAGVLLGLAVSVKIWYLAPWFAIVLWQLASRRPRAAARLLSCGGVALGIVIAPFAVLARTSMYDMVVRDQVSRPAAGDRLQRLPSVLGAQQFTVAGRPGYVAVALGVVVTLAAVVILLREPVARVVVGVLGVDLVVLLASPSYFQHYAALTAAPAAVVVGIAAARLRRRVRPARWGDVGLGALLALIAVSGVRVATTAEGLVFPAADFEAAAPSGCIVSDDPTALILMNRLTTDLRAGCRLDVDVTGLTYAGLRRDSASGRPVGRRHNIAWQTYLGHYLVSGRAFVVVRSRGDAIDRSVHDMLRSRPALARSDGLTLRSG